jgi:fatty-acyl-CoA synthase
MVMTGAGMDGKSIYELLDSEKVNASAAVPTVWLGLLQHLEENDLTLPYLDLVAIGGAACPRMMMETLENKYDVEVLHAWGMTEMSPIGTTGKLKYSETERSAEETIDLKLKQGRTPYLVEMKIVDDGGNDLPRDGKTSGHLLVRGPSISSAYYKRVETILDEDNWFNTGDIANIDAEGHMQITDRDKDVIKSGGEWISSIEVENTAIGCEGVAEAAVIAIPHEKWTERPLLIIVRKPGSQVSAEEILAFLEGKIASWWMPDGVEFVDELPHTATGKIQKMALRELFGGYEF